LSRDYVRIAKNFAEQAVKDKKRTRNCEKVRQAAQRFLDDLKRSRRTSCSFVFDSWHANDACDFIEKLPHVEGKWETPTITLHRSQIFFIVQLFGFRKRESIYIEGWGDYHPRRFTSALLAQARKNAKSTIAAAILIYCECCEPEEGAQIISAATTFPQASIIFNIGKRMVEKTAALRDAFGLEVWAKAVSRADTGATFKPIHAKASTQDGLNPSHVSLDEIHAHKSPDLLNVLTSAAGARLNPLWLYTTTEGFLNPGPWGELRTFAHRILEGVFGSDADHFLVLYFGIDDDDDPLDPKVWCKANPLLETNPKLLEAIKKEAFDAKQIPSKMPEFLIKRCNRQAAAPSSWVQLDRWKKCGGKKIDLNELEPYPCWGGLDLASTTDMASFRLIWDVDGLLVTYGWRFVPEEMVAYRSERGLVPYLSWQESGLIIATEGNAIDFSVIEKCIEDQFERFRIQMIAYDSWNAMDLVTRLVGKGIPMIEFVQGPKSYHPAMQQIERAYLRGELRYGVDPVLEWQASNLVPREDENQNKAPSKKRSGDKIDDMCSLFMARGVMGTKGERKKSIYEQGVI
jgi:phage terminase large subunit-like protein